MRIKKYENGKCLNKIKHNNPNNNPKIKIQTLII